MIERSALNIANAGFLDELYETYLRDPSSVEAKWREYFAALDRGVFDQSRSSQPVANGAQSVSTPAPGAAPVRATQDSLSAHAEEQVKVLELISAIRYQGHRMANLDPLELHQRPAMPDLGPEHYGLTEADMNKVFNTGSVFMKSEATLGEILSLLERCYLGSIGVELTHISSTEEKRFVQEKLENSGGQPELNAQKRRDTLHWLTAGRKLEEYLGKKYVGQKRFSLEGGESLIPCLDEVVQRAGTSGVKEIVIGMAHRGRLNVLVNILGKHPRVLFGEFEGKIDVGQGSGDVKYHLGFSSDVQTPGGSVHLTLAFNPSHLEIINPVVEGSVRARQERRYDNDRNEVLPLLVHGDAAFAGQGVVPETLNLASTRGYGTGGTVHVVVNNQIGFTTSDPLDSRSTLYCTDVAKLVQAPIFHVNGDDADAVMFVTQIALDFRMRFKKDVVIDIVCYRKHGHNEADEPFATQPMMYQKIKTQKGVRRKYAEQLAAEKVIAEGEADQMSEAYMQALEEDQVVSRPLVRANQALVVDWAPYLDTDWRDNYSDSAVEYSVDQLRDLGLKTAEIPEGFALHRAVQRIYDARREMAQGDRPIDWGFAELLAYATLLKHGYSVRLSGQDSQRGTFFHRHAVVHNQSERGTWCPLQNIEDNQPSFRVINSLLSEEAVLGFEYGFSTAGPNALVIWEAQFGDFVNGAQVVIDQFISSSESKWRRLSGLVMFLPHGYDGQGPEHSSARLERFLQICAEDNMQVCVPSSPGQMYHMLRRQMLRPYRKPLIVMTPKSLLRHRGSVSTMDELANGGFQVIIDEVEPIDNSKVTRIVLCTGKVYYDLVEKRRETGVNDVAIVRLEQLYPFPDKEILEILDRYPNAKELCWTQEEPRNQGSWFFMLSRRHLQGCVAGRMDLVYAGRDYSASPAVGYLNVHLEQQRALVESALRLDQAKAAA